MSSPLTSLRKKIFQFFFQTRSGDVIEAAWRAFGNQGNVWIQALLDIPKKLARAGFQVVF